MPDFVRPEANGSIIPPPQHTPSWSSTAGPSSSSPHARRCLPPTPNESRTPPPVALPDILIRTKSPRPRIQPSWVKEKVMSSMSVDDDDRSSSESEFAQSGVIRRNHKATMASRREENLARFALHATHISDSEEDSSPESRASTRSTSPRLVQSDHSNPQQALTLSVSSLAPFSSSTTTSDAPPVRRISQTDFPIEHRVEQSASRGSLTLATPPPIPPRVSPVPVESRASPAPSVDAMSRKISI
ncbi:unnamed protein product, partial [Strongylus vulgaris]